MSQVDGQVAYTSRQFLRSSLYERISTRPFLLPLEKQWLAFQLLRALEQCEKAGVSVLKNLSIKKNL